MKTVPDGDLARCGVGHHHGYHQSADPPRALIAQNVGTVQHRRDPAYRRPQQDSRIAAQVAVFKVQPCISHGLVRRDQGYLTEAIESPGLLASEQAGNVQVLDLCRDTHYVVGGIIGRHRSYARPTGDQSVPVGWHVVAQRGHRSKPRNYHTFVHASHPSSSFPLRQG